MGIFNCIWNKTRESPPSQLIWADQLNVLKRSLDTAEEPQYVGAWYKRQYAGAWDEPQ